MATSTPAALRRSSRRRSVSVMSALARESEEKLEGFMWSEMSEEDEEERLRHIFASPQSFEPLAPSQLESISERGRFRLKCNLAYRQLQPGDYYYEDPEKTRRRIDRVRQVFDGDDPFERRCRLDREQEERLQVLLESMCDLSFDSSDYSTKSDENPVSEWSRFKPSLEVVSEDEQNMVDFDADKENVDSPASFLSPHPIAKDARAKKKRVSVSVQVRRSSRILRKREPASLDGSVSGSLFVMQELELKANANGQGRNK